jgi:hypothetical protein
MGYHVKGGFNSSFEMQREYGQPKSYGCQAMCTLSFAQFFSNR